MKKLQTHKNTIRKIYCRRLKGGIQLPAHHLHNPKKIFFKHKNKHEMIVGRTFESKIRTGKRTIAIC